MSVEVTYVAEVGEESLIKAAEESRQSYLEYEKPAGAAATTGEIHRAESKTEGNLGRKVKVDALRSAERNMGLMGQYDKNENQTQGISIGTEFNFEPTKPKSHSKSRKWKTQARDSNLTTKRNRGPTSVKRSCSELDWPSPNSKRPKNVSSQKTPIAPKLKLAWETKGKADESDTVQQIEKTGMSGGLAMMWNSEITVNITSYSSYHIDAIIQNDSGKRWRCTGIYGHPEAQQKRHTCTLMRRLKGLSPLPWLCIGDFNEIMHPNEKSGGNDRNEETVTNMAMWESDHNLLVMNVQEKKSRVSYDRKTFFRVHYEDLWTPYEGCKNIVKEVWSGFGCRDDINPVQTFKNLSKAMMAQLQWWSKEEFGERKKRLKILMEKLQCAVSNNLQYDNGVEIKNLERQINNLLTDEEIYWKQRSRADWLKEGDKNTKFFHFKALSQRRKNRISGIENQQGQWLEDEEEIEREFGEYFQDLFTTSSPNQNQINAALKGLNPKMTVEMNEALDQPFTADEIFNALFQMCPTKAPGPDGLPAAFFQKHWQTVGSGVIDTCLHILNAQGDVTPLNHTYIALIPKVAKPKKVTDFRPISLCNVIYRIVAKTMANRLKQILHQVISPTQSAFIPNRLITDNIIIGYECLHKIRHNKSTKKGVVALKLDISKAYDRVEWRFLEQTMGQLGFSHKWIKLVLNCITTANFSIIISGKPKGLFRAQRGLRQGCPLSLYLFLICVEAFSNLLMQAERQNLIYGLRFGQEISITHLLFADDSLIFARASTNECNQLKALFDSYASASGQIFKYEKSSLFFGGSKVSEQQAETIKNIFQLNVVSRHERYLGLPSMIGWKKMSFFNDVKLKVLSKIANWQHKFFSTGGKEVLIKAVAQAIPAYAMSVFKLPIGLCEDIQRAVAKFWSLLWGRQVLKDGARWRIGRGDMVQVYKSNWIPRPNTFKPFSMPSLWEDAKVAELIDARNQWKADLILEHFNKEDAAAIMRIPLLRSPKMDEVCWHFDKKGMYTVKSGYQIALRLKYPDIPSTSEDCSCYWKAIWRLELPEKIKIFLWRAAQNMLPTVENLWKKKVTASPLCQICRRSVETISHALIECKTAGKIWKKSSLADKGIEVYKGQDMLEVWFQMSKRLCKAYFSKGRKLTQMSQLQRPKL
ncbi:reverse transcriptase domain-containing protein [Citrus sinensis]|nr:reverse transcriptase domain-containing protein [Citrus sinensis]